MPWGYRSPGLRRDERLRLARRPQIPHRPCTSGHRSTHGLGPGHFPEDDLTLAPSTATALRAPRPAPRRAARLGLTASSTTAPRVRNFLVANGAFWLEEFTSTAARRCGGLDAVPRLLARRGPVGAEHRRRPRHLEAIGFLEEAMATAYKRNPNRDDRRGLDVMAGRDRPDGSGGLDFGFKWNWAGCTHPGIHREGPDVPGAPPQRPDVCFLYAFSEDFVLAHQPRRSRARQGLPPSARCSATTGSSSPTCARTSTCGRTPQANAVHGPGVLAAWSGAKSAASTGGSSTSPTHRQLAEFVGAPTRIYRSMPRRSRRRPGASSGSRAGRRPRKSSRSFATTASDGRCCAS